MHTDPVKALRLSRPKRRLHFIELEIETKGADTFGLKTRYYPFKGDYQGCLESKTPPSSKTPPLLRDRPDLRFGGVWGFEGVCGILKVFGLFEGVWAFGRVFEVV